MSNSAILAVAGAGKTTWIAERCRDVPRRRLLVTYATEGQNVLRQRVHNVAGSTEVEVIGWYGFLIENFLKPYYPLFRKDQSYPGFVFGYRPHKGARGDEYFSDKQGRIGNERLAYVAKTIQKETNGKPIRRLEGIYEEIIFDESQDLVASDLVIIEALLKSKIDIHLVADIRQTVYETNTLDTTYKKFREAAKVNWFREQEKKGLLTITEMIINNRSCEEIVKLSNSIHDPKYGFVDAVSGYTPDPLVLASGISCLRPEHVIPYYETFNPLALRWASGLKALKPFEDKLEFSNFGEVKGVTVEEY